MRPSIILLLAAFFSESGLVHAGETVDYARQIKPLLKERCYACHGVLKQKGGLRLDTVKSMLAGGDDGPVISLGKDAQSLLVERITTADKTHRMPPPSEGEALTAGQIEMVRLWIRQGAKGPAGEKGEEDPRDHWAFRKPVRPKVPAVKNQAWVRNPIDAFIAAEHEKHGLTPMPEAAQGLLLRRVYLDLIGLPPTREELHGFLTDTSPDAYEKVVDRLLASPHYGERWGRHWMDVWRYSDWYGRRHVPDVWNSAPQIWRWRDWIVKSLDADKGYDRMVQEMLAADEIAPADDEALVATGYIVRNWYALNPHQWMRDMVEHTGKAFLGLTFNCAHCHDHKYDPISQEEYFRFRAFFEPLELRQDRVAGEGEPGPFQKYDYSTLRKIVKLGAVRVYDAKLDAKTFMYVGGDERNRIKDKPPVRPGAPAFLGGERLKIEPVELPTAAYFPSVKPFVVKEEIAKRQQVLQAALDVLAKQPNASSAAKMRVETARSGVLSMQARIAADAARFGHAKEKAEDLARAAAKAERFAALCAAKEAWQPMENKLAVARQNVDKAAEKDKAGALAAVKKLEPQVAALKKGVDQAEKNLTLTDAKYTPLGPIYPKTSTGRRKALAEWLTNRNNPLTARVAVNHIWLRHFDRALVETVFDFGRNGKKPSHPELLDWLAVELMDPLTPPPHPRPLSPGGERGESAPPPHFTPERERGEWSMKHLHRLIVTSATYRMQSAANERNLARDSDNRFFWRANARRMEAEIVRDSILASAGELDRTIGGQVLENSQEASKRRSLYFSVFPEDGGHLKFLEIFDAPDPCDAYRRSTSVMPQQALALTNNQIVIQQSRTLARKLSAALAKGADEGSFIAAAFEHLLSRNPSAQELATCREFLRQQVDLYRKTNPKELNAPGPSSDPAQRARESLVRVLYNHNDFITVR